MTSDKMERLAVVSDLLEMAKPLEEIAALLAATEWDYEGVGVELTRQHLSTALRRYLDAKLSAKDVEVWANLIESREDVRFEVGREQQVEEVLYELANPALTQTLDPDRASALFNALALRGGHR